MVPLPCPEFKMVDLVLVVDDPIVWHRKNLKLNSAHYSSLKYLGPGGLASIQETWACGVYYNPYITLEGQLIKYGVMSIHTLHDDLFNWSHCYAAGRLHKPVREIQGPNDPETKKLIIRNRDSALRAALLQLPQRCRKVDLYHAIAEISYIGDFRMFVGENPNKVKNIVAPLVLEFDKVYYPLINQLRPYVKIDEGNILSQVKHPKVQFSHLMHLPIPIQRALARRMKLNLVFNDVEEAMVQLAFMPETGSYVRRAIEQVVWGSSILQTIQGVFTAGPVRSVKYALEKMQKKKSGT